MGACKSRASIEFEFLTEADRQLIRKLMQADNNLPHYFMKHPSEQADQLVDLSYIKTATAHDYTIKAYTLANSDNSNAALSAATEIASGDYIKLASPEETGISVDNDGAHSWSYFFFTFENIYALDVHNIHRLSLLLHNPGIYTYPGLATQGFKIDVYDDINSAWVEVAKSPFSFVNPTYGFQHVTVMRPVSRSNYDFKRWKNYYDSDATAKITFRVRNLNAITSRTFFGLKYVALLVDGWPVAWTNPHNFSHTSNATPAGYTGTMELSEI
jgi:hypothetical protein